MMGFGYSESSYADAEYSWRKRQKWDEKHNPREGSEECSFTATDYEITLPMKIYDELMHAVKTLGKESLEVGGLLKVHREGSKIEVRDYCLLKQEVSSGDFEINEEEVAKWAITKMEESDFNEWNGWWHSHHNMGLFWSGTDDDMFSKLLGKQGSNGECLGIVFTTNGKFLTRFDYKTPIADVQMNKLSTIVVGKDGEGDVQKMDSLIEQNVERSKPLYKGSFIRRSDGSEKKVSEVDENVPEKVPYVDEWEQGYSDVDMDELVEDEELWGTMFTPQTLHDLLELTEAHKQVFEGWSLENECLIWGLDYKKVFRAVAEEKKVEKRRERSFGRGYEDF